MIETGLSTANTDPNRASIAPQRRLALWTDVSALFAATPQTQVERSQRRTLQIQQRDERLRRREDQHADAAAADAIAPSPSEVTLKAERRMLTGSDAAREQAQAQADRHARMTRPGDDFRRTLADARRETPRASTSPHNNETASAHAGPESASAPAKSDESPAQQAAPARGTAASAHDSSLQNVKAPSPDASAVRSTTQHLGRTAAGEAGATSVQTQRAAAAPQVQPVSAVRVAAGAPSTAIARVAGDASTPRAAPPVTAPIAADRAAKTGTRAPATRAEAATTERSDDANFERVLRVIRMQLARDKSAATIRLDPPELGKLELKLELRGSQLALDVETRSEAARQLLVDQLDTLRRGLEASGLTLERVDVRIVEPTPTGDPSPQRQDSPLPQFASDGGQRFSRGDEGRAPQFVSAATPAEPAAVETLEPLPAAESLVNLWA